VPQPTNESGHTTILEPVRGANRPGSKETRQWALSTWQSSDERRNVAETGEVLDVTGETARRRQCGTDHGHWR